MSELAETVVTAGAARSSRDAWRELWAARDVVRAFLVRSLRVRYRQAVLGVAWAVVQPLALLVPFALFLRSGASVRAYAPGALAALVGWQFVSSAVAGGAGALVTEAPLVRKTWFPREAPVVAAVGAAAVELGVGLVLFALVGPLLGAHLGAGLVALPVVLVAAALVALAVAVPLAAANAVYRDVRHALPFATLLWLFVSPVAFPVERVAARWRVPYAVVNPAVGPLVGLRRVLAEGRWPAWSLLAASTASALVVGWFGHRRFVRVAPTLPDVV